MNLPHSNHFESELLLASLPSYIIQLFRHLTCNDDAAGLIVSTYRGKNCFQILGMALHGNNSGKAKKTGHLLLPWVSMWLLSAISLKEIMALGFNGRAVLFLAMMCAFMEGPDLKKIFGWCECSWLNPSLSRIFYAWSESTTNFCANTSYSFTIGLFLCRNNDCYLEYRMTFWEFLK